ncbi:MAG: FIST signal transduction protein [Flavobacteriales bacterium]
MKVQQHLWREGKGWVMAPVIAEFKPTLVLAFGGIDTLTNESIYSEISKVYPDAQVVLASTAGEIHGEEVHDGTVSVTACRFDKTTIKVVEGNVSDCANSFDCGKAITARLDGPGLCHVLVLSDGISVNGDDLVRGINYSLPKNVVVTGGLAADAGRFTKTLVGANQEPQSNRIVAIGFYGNKLQITHGSQGGWDLFGPVRQVTKATDNVLFELDGENALDIYKRYLGPRANELPGSALLFPLCILGDDQSQLVRTILSIDEQAGTLRFAGNIPMGARVQFMMANFDRLVDGAAKAAEQSHEESPDLVLMVSCVGRKIVLDQRIEEEVESVCQYFGNAATYTGFYSNGEISPMLGSTQCSLHNQTMTITTYHEIE